MDIESIGMEITTKPEAKDFDTAMKSFVKGCEEKTTSYFEKNYSNLKPPVMLVEEGRRYHKVVRKDADGTSSSVHCFVDAKKGPTFGDVLKAASWKTPAKHARGNIFDDHNGLRFMGEYGPAYLK